MAEAATCALEIRRTFAAPRELVFRAWTEPERLARWFCPETCEVLDIQADLRVGGEWTSTMRLPNGVEHTHLGRYLEITPPERLVMSHRWRRADGNLSEDTTLTITLLEEDGGTTMIFEHSGLPTEKTRDDHAEGWGEAMANLAAYLDSVA